MCGVLGTNKLISENEFSEALDYIKRRGPDDFGILKHNQFILGHRRLSIIDLSSLGHQPMVSTDEKVALVFNGEIYNYKDIKQELVSLGVQFKSSSDTEVILQGYLKFGKDIFGKLRGMWAVGISDLTTNKLILSRDFFGIKPLYYRHEDCITFSSELSPIIKMHSGKPDKEAYRVFFNLGMMVGKHTGVEWVNQVLPGEIVEFDLTSNTVSKTSILECLTDIDSTSFDLESTLTDSIKLHFTSDVPVGVLLSGGTDSSLIATLSKNAGFKPKCFCVQIEGSEDGYYAKEIANHLGLDLDIVNFDKKIFLDVYSELTKTIDIPISDISILPTSLVFRSISGKSKVVLSGEGGDELFAGYERHKFFKGTNSVEPYVVWPISVSPSVDLRFLNPLLSRLQRFVDYIRGDMNSLYLDYVSTMYLPGQRKKILSFMSDFYTTNSIYKKIKDTLFWDIVYYLSNMLMIKADRSSMAHSIEVRVPFVDRKVFSVALKDSQKYNKENLKSILKKYLPAELVDRKKQGFGFPKEYMFEKEIYDDYIKAVKFHEKYEGFFSWIELGFPKYEDKPDFFHHLMLKFPRFAFGVIVSYKIWVRYGLE